MTPPGHTAHGGRNGTENGYEHLASEVGDRHVAVVGCHDLGSIRPDIPAHLLEITKVDLGSGWEPGEGERSRGRDDDREAQTVAIHQFLAD